MHKQSSCALADPVLVLPLCWSFVCSNLPATHVTPWQNYELFSVKIMCITLGASVSVSLENGMSEQLTRFLDDTLHEINRCTIDKLIHIILWDLFIFTAQVATKNIIILGFKK